jgi:hypothetical protein
MVAMMPDMLKCLVYAPHLLDRSVEVIVRSDISPHSTGKANLALTQAIDHFLSQKTKVLVICRCSKLNNRLDTRNRQGVVVEVAKSPDIETVDMGDKLLQTEKTRSAQEAEIVTDVLEGFDDACAVTVEVLLQPHQKVMDVHDSYVTRKADFMLGDVEEVRQCRN